MTILLLITILGIRCEAYMRTSEKVKIYMTDNLNLITARWKPIGVSAFELSEAIPENLKTQIATIEEMERILIDGQ